MKQYRVALIVFCMLVSGVASAQTFTLKSADIGGQMTGQQVFNGFGCTGENISPQLSWENAPEGTQSFAVTMYDPDAPTGSGWWHWLIFDIPAEVTELKANAGNPSAGLAPQSAIQAITDYGKAGYGGPCPPEGHGFHQYIITVYALKTKSLGLDQQAKPAVIGYYLNSNTIQKASIVAYFQR
ncbi:MAG: YbhB/YbcL family Raf kinase inhibitor-like protein [Bacteroidota bacterium]